jgi:hypothetical protein
MMEVAYKKTEYEKFLEKMKPFSCKCSNCGIEAITRRHGGILATLDNKGIPMEAQKRFFQEEIEWKWWRFWVSPRPAHNKRECLLCGAKWVEELGSYK